MPDPSGPDGYAWFGGAQPTVFLGAAKWAHLALTRKRCWNAPTLQRSVPPDKWVEDEAVLPVVVPVAPVLPTVAPLVEADDEESAVIVVIT